LVVTLSRTSDNKTAVQIIDAGLPSPLSEDFDLGEKWIHDSKQWDEVYTVKPYEYMAVIAMGGVPMFSKEQNKYIDKEELDKIKEEAEKQRIDEALTEPTKDFSDIAESSGVNIIDGNDIKDDDDDLPF
jgi:hypothetical protein